jgi:hypothetical protein
MKVLGTKPSLPKWMLFSMGNSPSAVNVAAQLTVCCGVKISWLREAYLLQYTINDDAAAVRCAYNRKKT